MIAARLIIVAGALLAFIAPPVYGSPASEGAIDRASELMDALDYEAARQQLARAIRSGRNGADQMRDIYLLSGVVEAAFGDEEAAIRMFQHALTIDWNADLPAGQAPKIQEPFLAAQQALQGQRSIDVQCRQEQDANRLVLQVAADPLTLVIGAQARYTAADGSEHEVMLARGAQYQLSTPADAASFVQLVALDVHGNQLTRPCFVPITLSRDLPSKPIAVNSSQSAAMRERVLVGSAATEEASRPHLLTRWYVWSTITVSLASTAGYFALESRNDQLALQEIVAHSQQYEFSDARNREDSYRQNHRTATIFAGAAAGAALTGLIVWHTTRKSRRQSSVSAHPFLASHASGVAVSLGF